jgi:selenide,water dikinase
MLAASGVAGTIHAPAVELLPGVLDLAREGVVPGGTVRNLEYLSGFVSWGDLEEPEQLVLADAQTSGGLLVATRNGGRLEDAFERRGIPLRRIGVTADGPAGRTTVTGRVGAA